MGVFHFFKGTDINQGVRVFQETTGAVLLECLLSERWQERTGDGGAGQDGGSFQQNKNL